MTQKDQLQQLGHQTLVPRTVYVRTIRTEDTLAHTTVPKTNYLLSREPADILAAALYYQWETQFVASGSTFLAQPEIHCESNFDSSRAKTPRRHSSKLTTVLYANYNISSLLSHLKKI